jgi:iron complex transport system substrate-binding protein
MVSCAVMSAPKEEQKDSEMSLVSTSVAICRILDELGYDNVIGVPESSQELPERYKNVMTVGAPMTPDYEKIKSLSPDMVLTPKSLEGTLGQDFDNAGLNSAFLDLSSVEGMYKAISSLGRLLKCEDRAAAMVADYENYMSSYKAQSGDAPSVLLLMAFPDGFYLVATEKSYVGGLVKLAGGVNVYENYKGDENGFVNINPEDVSTKKPDIVMVFAHYAEADAFAYMKKEFQTGAAWQRNDAIKNGRVSYLPSEYFGMSATLSWKDGLDYLKPALFGE